MKHPKLVIGAASLAGLGVLYLVTGGKRPAPLPLGPEPMSVPPSLGPVKWTQHLSDGFFRLLIAMVTDFRLKGATITEEDVLGVLNAESGVRASVPNAAGSGCIGLNQICDLKSVGFQGPPSEFLALTAEQQFPYTRRFFEQAGPPPKLLAKLGVPTKYPLLTNMGRMYLLNFNPGNLGLPDNTILYTRETGGKSYSQNQASLDPERKGYIEIADMDKFVRRSLASGPRGAKPYEYWAELRMRLNNVRSQPAPVAVAGFGGGPCYACLTSSYGCGGQGCSRGRKG